MRKILLVIDDFNDLLALESFFRRIGFDVLSLGKDTLVSDAMLGFVPDFVIATAKGRTVDGSKLAIRLKSQTHAPVVALICANGLPPVLSPEAEVAVDAVIEIPFQPKTLLALVADLTGIDKRGLLEKFDRLRSAKLQGLDDPNLFQSDDGVKSGIKIVRGRVAGTTSRDEASRAELSEDIIRGMIPESSQPVVETKPLREELTAPAPERFGIEAKPPPLLRPGADKTVIDAPEVKTERLKRYDKFLENHDDDVSRVISRADAHAAREKLRAASVGEKDQLDRIDAEKRAFVRQLFEGQAAEPQSLAQQNAPNKK